MKKIDKRAQPASVPANPAQWSAQSRQSVAFHFRRVYSDKHYHCLRCQTACVFTAQDQKYCYEVQKASINQLRTLCHSCRGKANHLRARLRACEAQWMRSKACLRKDPHFLADWSSLLQELEGFAVGKADTARKNMLARLLANAGEAARREEHQPM